jgi:hypothetical protein
MAALETKNRDAMNVVLFQLDPDCCRLSGQRIFEDCIRVGKERPEWRSKQLSVNVRDVELDFEAFNVLYDPEEDREAVMKGELGKYASLLRYMHPWAKRAHWKAISIFWAELEKVHAVPAAATDPLASVLACYVDDRPITIAEHGFLDFPASSPAESAIIRELVRGKPLSEETEEKLREDDWKLFYQLVGSEGKAKLDRHKKWVEKGHRLELDDLTAFFWDEYKEKMQNDFVYIFFRCLDTFLYPGCGDDNHVLLLHRTVSLFPGKTKRTNLYLDKEMQYPGYGETSNVLQLNHDALSSYFERGFIDAHPVLRALKLGSLPRKPHGSSMGESKTGVKSSEPVLTTDLRKKVRSFLAGQPRQKPPCDRCGEPEAEFVCSRCGLGFYCSVQCQTEDWSTHEHVCFLVNGDDDSD